MTNSLEVNAVQPPTLDHFIGNGNAVERVRIALEAMFNQGGGSRFPHCLMLGPKGTGKTLMAQIIARETGLGEKYTETLGQAVMGSSDLNGMLLDAENGILFIDEIHSLPYAGQLDLLKALDQGKIYLNAGLGEMGKPTEMKLEKFTLLGATTEEYEIMPPLLDRFKLVLRFDFYSNEDLCEIVRQRAKALNWKIESGLIEQIAQRSKQTPRLALRLLESCWRTVKASHGDSLTAEHFEKTLRLEQLDPLGCDSVEQAYLRLLNDSKGKARLNVIASRLGLPPRTIEGLEQFLIRKELIDKNESGFRILTFKGRQHLLDNGN